MALYNYQQLVELWEEVGGDPALAGTMAAIALAESSGNPDNINPAGCRSAAIACQPCNISPTHDYSIGLWQINYYGANFDSRKARYGCPYALWDPVRNALAAKDLAGGGGGLDNWSTYTTGAYRDFLPGPGGAASGSSRSAATHGPHVEVGGANGTTGVERPMTFPEAFHRLERALGVTIPTRVKWANYASRRFKRAIK